MQSIVYYNYVSPSSTLKPSCLHSLPESLRGVQSAVSLLAREYRRKEKSTAKDERSGPGWLAQLSEHLIVSQRHLLRKCGFRHRIFSHEIVRIGKSVLKVDKPRNLIASLSTLETE